MSAVFKARAIGRTRNPADALRMLLVQKDPGTLDGAPARLPKGFELLPAVDVQQRLAAQGLKVSLDFVARLQADAVAQLEHGVVPVVQQHGEHAVAVVDRDDGSRKGHRGILGAERTRELVPDASRDGLEALGQILSLRLREAANQAHAGGLTADPKLKEALACLCEQLQAVLQIGPIDVGQSEISGKVLVGHGESSGQSQSIAQRVEVAKTRIVQAQAELAELKALQMQGGAA